MQYMNDAINLPPEVFFGSRTPDKPPPVIGLFRTIPERRNVTPPPDIDNGPLWPSSDCSDVGSLTLTGTVYTLSATWMFRPYYRGVYWDVDVFSRIRRKKD
jgi:hypothetical protein